MRTVRRISTTAAGARLTLLARVAPVASPGFDSTPSTNNVTSPFDKSANRRHSGSHIGDTNRLQVTAKHGFNRRTPAVLDFDELSDALHVLKARRFEPALYAFVALAERGVLDRLQRGEPGLRRRQVGTALIDQAGELGVLLPQLLNLAGDIGQVSLKLFTPLPQALFGRRALFEGHFEGLRIG